MPESTLLITGWMASWPIAVGREKGCDGGPAYSQVSYRQVSARGNNPADGGWTDSRRALAWRLRRRFQSIQLTTQRSSRANPAAGRCRQRAGQGGADPAAVGGRQCRCRGAIDEECRRDGAGGIPESQHPAADQG